MAHPLRIQRKRVAGWRMPEGAVYVGRPTIFGNPWYDDWPPDLCVRMFREWITGRFSMGGIDKAADIIKRLPDLRGKQLACWCSLDKPCHADVLCELANRERSGES